jgi:hypothetical protein
VVNTILKEADLFCPNSVRINFTIYHKKKAKNLKMDLNELGVVVKDQGKDQYVRKI